MGPVRAPRRPQVAQRRRLCLLALSGSVGFADAIVRMGCTRGLGAACAVGVLLRCMGGEQPA